MLFSLASTLENVRDLRVGKACRGRPGSASETFISACTPFGDGSQVISFLKALLCVAPWPLTVVRSGRPKRRTRHAPPRDSTWEFSLGC